MTKKLKDSIKDISINTEEVIKNYLFLKGINSQYKCNNELIRTFGLVGKFIEFSIFNQNADYCVYNSYTCCSNIQIESSMKVFGEALIGLKSNLEPLIEMALALKTERMVNYLSIWIKNPICSPLFVSAFNKDPLLKKFNLRSFLKKIIE